LKKENGIIPEMKFSFDPCWNPNYNRKANGNERGTIQMELPVIRRDGGWGMGS
jgi:hypothetical protein